MSDLAGCRILIVEDESLVAMLLETIVEDLGCQVLGPCATVSEALETIAADLPTAALLDINVGGEAVFPVAEVLRDKGVSFVFSSGYGAQGLPDEWRENPVIQKPFTEDAVRQALAKATQRVSA